MKIGITISDLKLFDKKSEISSSGISQHIFILYEYLLNKSDVFLISNSMSETNKDKCKFIYYENNNELAKLDIILVIGLDIYSNKVKEINKDVKIIFYNMGSEHVNDIYTMLELAKDKRKCIHVKKYDEVWISPHFEYAIDYYRYKFKIKNIKICPYFWDPIFLSINKSQVKTLDTNISNIKNIDIAVFEPNFYKEKACFIPIIACEFAKDYINTAKIFSTLQYKNKSIIDYFNISDLYKEGKLTAEERYTFSYIMSNHCNIVLSYVENCDLNFLYLECFYLGIPLIHNSKMLKDYGYYYEGCNATQAANHIKYLRENDFDRDAYIEKHKEILFKYSLKNPEVTNFLDSNLNLDCITTT